MNTTELPTKPNDETIVSADELSMKEIVNFLKIFSKVWKKALAYLVILTVVFGLIGLLAAKTSPKEYDAKCTLITDQVAASASGSLQGLASLAGISIPGAASGDGLGADLYPMILSNKPFLIELSKTPIYFNNNKRPIILENYFKKQIKPDVVTRFLNSLKNPLTLFKSPSKNPDEDNPFVNRGYVDSSANKAAELFFSNKVYISSLTAQNKAMIATLSSRIKFKQEGKQISLSIKMPEAKLSAEATKTVLNLLIKYITKFKTGKQLETLNFLEARTAENEIKYKQSQQRLAGFKDNNYNVIYESLQAKEQQLQNEFTLAFTTYNQFLTQLEQARIQLKKETPLFTVVEPIYIPEVSSSDSNKQIVSYATTGFFIGFLLSVYLFIRTFYLQTKSQKKNSYNIN